MSGVATRLKIENGDLHVSSVQDVEPVLERNHYLRSVPQKSDWGRHTHSIPCVILLKWANEEYAKGNTELRMFTPEFWQTVVYPKLQDPEWAYLKVDGPKTSMGWGD